MFFKGNNALHQKKKKEKKIFGIFLKRLQFQMYLYFSNISLV